MQNSITTNNGVYIQSINRYVVNFEKLHKEEFLFESDREEGTLKINTFNAFDYERLPDNNWIIHLDIHLRVRQFVQLIIRNSYRLTSDLEHVFTNDVIKPIMKDALETTIKVLSEKCKEETIDFDASVIPYKPFIDKFANETIETFITHRLEEERKRGEQNLIEGMTIKSDAGSKLIINATIIIIDQVLFKSPLFERRYNVDAFEKAVPIGGYLTMREHCLKINNSSVKLNWYLTTYFVLSLDCALQLLIGDHYETIKAEIEKEGLDEPTRSQFIESGSKLLETLMNIFAEKNFMIANLEQRYDWNSLIK
jgi:hypothetical protein